jgi:uncharacterized membrane protein
MQDITIPLELISNLLSIIILVFIFVKYLRYKKKLEVLKGLNELKEQKELTKEDKEFIKSNLKEYKIFLAKDESRIKVVYPVFILIAGVLLAMLSFSEAMIHLNVLVVAYIYLYITKIHNKNFATFLEELAQDLD